MDTIINNPIEKEYNENIKLANKFLPKLIEELNSICEKENINLGFPIEGRIKTFTSVQDKMQKFKFSTLEEIYDLTGIRIITLWQRDVIKLDSILEKYFEILYKSDISTRLTEKEFGYQSFHYEIKLKPEWLHIPTLSGFNNISAELQVRTVAQHLWASASHNLQYKKENDVPIEIQRSINRVAALLETVDLEFERVLKEKDTYIEEIKDSENSKIKFLEQPINADTIRLYSEWKFPGKSISSYWQSELLNDLNKNKYKTLRSIDCLVEAALPIVKEYAKQKPEVFNYSTDFITKSLAIEDPDFRNKHGFSNFTILKLKEIAGTNWK